MAPLCVTSDTHVFEFVYHARPLQSASSAEVSSIPLSVLSLAVADTPQYQKDKAVAAAGSVAAAPATLL